MMGKETMLNEATKNALKPVHADELLYLFDFGFDLTLDKDIQMREIMFKYWTNFAKYGNPSPVMSDDLAQWLTYSSEKVILILASSVFNQLHITLFFIFLVSFLSV